MSVFSLTATTTGSVVSIKVTPTSSGVTNFNWVREQIRARIGGITVEDNGANQFTALSNAGVGPQNPAVGTIDSWDGSTLVVTIVSGSFTNRTTLDKITYGY